MSVYDYAALREDLEALFRSFSLLPRVIGRTALGRAVFALDLGGSRSRSLIVGGIRGCDAAVCRLLLQFTATVCRHRESREPLFGMQPEHALRDCGVTIVPCLNPDGLELCFHGVESAKPLRRFLLPLLQQDVPWQANTFGVDLTHNFICGFSVFREQAAANGITSPAASGFPGICAQSEAETQSLTRLCRQERFHHALLLQGGDDTLTCALPAPNNQQDILASKVLADTGKLRLRAAKEPAGDFISWFSAVMQRPAFSAELGKGSDPSPNPSILEFLLMSVLL